MELPAYRDPSHPTNEVRPLIRCLGCGKFGCVGKHWGNWCFECNVARIERITSNLKNCIRAAATTPKQEDSGE